MSDEDTIPAISLWQPWASAVALKSKEYETRHWATNYRGPLVIHAARRLVRSELELFRLRSFWRAALKLPPNLTIWGHVPFGALVAICTLTDCLPTEDISSGYLDDIRSDPETLGMGWTERSMGNFEPGRFAWRLQGVKILAKPIPFKGKQGFFRVPKSAIASATEPAGASMREDEAVKNAEDSPE